VRPLRGRDIRPLEEREKKEVVLEASVTVGKIYGIIVIMQVA
jgi:hypothetical protein